MTNTITEDTTKRDPLVRVESKLSRSEGIRATEVLLVRIGLHYSIQED